MNFRGGDGPDFMPRGRSGVARYGGAGTKPGVIAKKNIKPVGAPGSILGGGKPRSLTSALSSSVGAPDPLAGWKDFDIGGGYKFDTSGRTMRTTTPGGAAESPKTAVTSPKVKPIDILGGGGIPQGPGGLRGGPGGRAAIGVMHSGGKVPRDGIYELEEGEEVTPAPKKKKQAKESEPEGRNSEYRKVYLSRSKGKN